MTRAVLLMWLFAAGCTKLIDHGDRDAPNTDPRVLGPQLDRMGRPYVSNLLIAPLDDLVPRTAKRDAYNQADDPSTWATILIDPSANPPRTIVAELAANIALYDPISFTGGPNVCGTSLMYQSPASLTSYLAAATLLADDRIYVDTTKATCEAYLAVELGVAQSVSGCGGRTPLVDTFDVTYTALATGLLAAAGFGDDVSAHDDVSATAFPFLGNPH
ncbi:MAG: hypothetical protein AB7O24_02300 [Kofleriaceae bacterium]